MCRAELRTLNPIIAEYAGQVDFYLVAFNESAATLEEYIAENGYANMTAAQPVGSMLRDLKIVSQSSVMAMDSTGVITFRKGYGGRGADFSAEFANLVQ
ncbi:MAG: hypothetical protein OXL37_15170 [Chloroflexota bacterium]|nr:hypothetical protein [Chloroflexota bacterium]MDE2961725.1 hypothetical protein [Chloroflexota bacterium]